MPIDNAFASLAVSDLATALAFYGPLLGAPRREIPEVLEWSLPDGGGVQVYLLPERAGGCSCTLLVTDLTHIAEGLRTAGTLGDGTVAPGDRMDVLMVRDPDGNSIALVELHAPNNGQPADPA